MNQSRRLRAAVAVTSLLLLLGLGVGTMLLLDSLRTSARTAAVDSVERIARVVESTVNRHFLAVDGVLAGLPPVLALLARDGRVEASTANRMLRDLGFQNFNFRDLLLLRPDGRPFAAALPASRGRVPPIDPAELAEAAGSGAVSILGPARNPLTAEWSLFFVRRASLPGQGDLLAVAEVPLPLIATLLSAVSDTRGLLVTLERDDGRVLTRLPPDEAALGRSRDAAQGPPVVDGLAREVGDSLLAARPTLYRGIHVVVGLDRASAMAAWRENRARLLPIALGVGVLLVALALALNLAMRQRERIEAVRARGRAVLESAIDSMPDGFVMFDAEDRLVICNARYREMYAVTAPLIRPGVRFTDLIREGARRGQYPQAGDDIEGFVARISAWHRGDNPPIERLLPDGRWILVTERRTPAGGTVGIRTDITALKRAMAELATARDAAAAATEAKSRFLARMSHELRTPLNGVLGIAQALAADPRLPAGARAEARTLEMAGRHLLAVANDVLDLAKVEAGRLDLHPTPTGLPPLLASCATMVRAVAAEKRIDLRVALDPALPAHVAADQTRLRQLLLNLLTNAIKFTPEEGVVELLATRLPVADADGIDPRVRVRIEVRDTGPGVPEAARDAVFGDFVQLDRATAATGAGLGLAIASHIVERMDGRIGCAGNDRTVDGSGAVFWVELPFTVTVPEVTALRADARRAGGAGLRLLIVDDVPANLAVARALLEAAGHVTHCVPGGAEAVQAMAGAGGDGAAPPFDAVLMDVMMPGMDGLEATRRIRALPGAAARVPILALTASVFAEDVAACRAAGMDAHLAKPIDRDALLALLARVTGGAGAAPRSDTPAPPLLGAWTAAPAAMRGLDPAEAARLVAEFETELSHATASLAAAEGPAAIAAAAHRLAGAAGTLDAPRLTAAARRLQATTDAAESRALRSTVATIAAETLSAIDAGRRRAEAA